MHDIGPQVEPKDKLASWKRHAEDCKGKPDEAFSFIGNIAYRSMQNAIERANFIKLLRFLF